MSAVLDTVRVRAESLADAIDGLTRSITFKRTQLLADETNLIAMQADMAELNAYIACHTPTFDNSGATYDGH